MTGSLAPNLHVSSYLRRSHSRVSRVFLSLLHHVFLAVDFGRMQFGRLVDAASCSGETGEGRRPGGHFNSRRSFCHRPQRASCSGEDGFRENALLAQASGDNRAA